MKKVIALAVGGLLIVLALIYGFSGMLVPSIPSRADNITRWESELVTDRQEIEKALAEADRLGKLPASTSDGPSPFEHQLARVDHMQASMRATIDAIDHERGRRKEMIIITAVLAGLGVLAVMLGLRLRRRA